MAKLERELSVEAVMEPGGTYGDALAWQLHRAGIVVYRVSSKRVPDAAEVYDGVPSLHDAKAAYLIGRLHLQGAGQRWQEPNEERREMTALLTQLARRASKCAGSMDMGAVLGKVSAAVLLAALGSPRDYPMPPAISRRSGSTSKSAAAASTRGD